MRSILSLLPEDLFVQGGVKPLIVNPFRRGLLGFGLEGDIGRVVSKLVYGGGWEPYGALGAEGAIERAASRCLRVR